MPMFNSDIIPDTTGRQLGTPDQRYDASIRNLNVSGSVSGNFTGLSVYNFPWDDVPFMASPVFDGLRNSAFRLVLSANVASSAFINQNRGQLYAVIIVQNAVGGFTFAWPPNVRGGMDIGTGIGETSAQLFISDGTNLIPLTPGEIS